MVQGNELACIPSPSSHPGTQTDGNLVIFHMCFPVLLWDSSSLYSDRRGKESEEFHNAPGGRMEEIQCFCLPLEFKES